MKKALAILAALALVASAATAEITVGGWGRGLFSVSNSGATGAKTGNVNKASWGGAPRIGFTIAGSADKVGVVADIKADTGAVTGAVAGQGDGIALGDQQFIWAKPIDQIKLTLGRAQMDTLRGNACFGTWDWDRAYGAGVIGEDFTFQRLSTGYAGSATYDNKQGLVAEITPIEGLYIGLALRDVNGVNALIEDSIKNGQYAIGYTIAGVGMIRAQYIGHTTGTVNDSDFQAAFKVTAVENLYADIGFSMNLDSNSTASKNVSLYVNYAIDKAKIHAAGRVALPKTGDMGMAFGAGIDYALEGGFGLAADVRYTNKILTGGTKDRITFFFGATESLGNGLIGIGFQGASEADFGYAIPVRFEYWF